MTENCEEKNISWPSLHSSHVPLDIGDNDVFVPACLAGSQAVKPFPSRCLLIVSISRYGGFRDVIGVPPSISSIHFWSRFPLIINHPCWGRPPYLKDFWASLRRLLVQTPRCRIYHIPCTRKQSTPWQGTGELNVSTSENSRFTVFLRCKPHRSLHFMSKYQLEGILEFGWSTTTSGFISFEHCAKDSPDMQKNAGLS